MRTKKPLAMGSRRSNLTDCLYFLPFVPRFVQPGLEFASPAIIVLKEHELSRCQLRLKMIP